MSDAYTRVYHRGVQLNRRTLAMLLTLEHYLGRAVDGIPQGSYHGGTSQSAGTHDGGGAVDIYDHNLDEVAKAGRRAGFAMWHRTTLPGVWSAHCHGIAVGDREMSNGAADQVEDYFNHRNGLAGHAYDPSWRPDPLVIYDYEGTEDEVTNEEIDRIVDRITKVVDARVDPLQERMNAIARAASDRDAAERRRQDATAVAVLAAIDDLPAGTPVEKVRAIVQRQFDRHATTGPK